MGNRKSKPTITLSTPPISPLVELIANRDISAILKLFEKVYPILSSSKDFSPKTLLSKILTEHVYTSQFTHLDSISDQSQFLHLLIESGAEVNWALFCGYNPDFIHDLIDNSRWDRFNKDILTSAILKFRVDDIEYLLQQNSDITHSNSQLKGWTSCSMIELALQYGTKTNNLEMLSFFIKSKSNANKST